MKVDVFDFHLPEENIALHPASPREAGRLLHIAPPADLHDYHVRDLPHLLQPGDALVFNDTKVIPARLEGWRCRHIAGEKTAPATAKAKKTAAKEKTNNAAEMSIAQIGVTLHMRVSAAEWRAFAKPARRLRVGEIIVFFANTDMKYADGKDVNIRELLSAAAKNHDESLRQGFIHSKTHTQDLTAKVMEKGETGEVLLRFNKSGADLDAALSCFGRMPLPPYIAARRKADARDEQDYQTVYARKKGAVAAPTAGLHFTPSLLEALRARGIEQYFVTLHVGAGTFLPVKTDDTKNHKMHSEIGSIDAETAHKLQCVKARGSKIIAVGTTALRVLETAATEDGDLQAWSGSTDIFITPGYRFRFVDRLMTNFHLPRSTLFMLVASFSGLQLMQKAYRHAIKTGYRFYSYGDTCLLDLAQTD